MAIGSGLDAQLGAVDEVTYGTPVAVTSFYEFREESLSLEVQRIESSALRPGRRVLGSARWAAAQKAVSGDITMELGNVGFGRWFKHALGAVATAQPDAANSPTVYDHTFTPGALPVGQTIQVGRPDRGGTVRAFTYHGCKIETWTLECKVGEYATLTVAIVGEDEDTATALATASYPTALRPMTFVQGTLTIGGVAQDVRSISLEGTNGLATDRYHLGSQLRKEPIEIGTEETQARTYLGTIETEFDSLTNYARFTGGTEAALVLTFEGGIIEDAFTYKTVITSNVRFDGTTPNVPDSNIVMQNLPFKVIDNGTTSISVLYRTTDATV